MKFSVEEKGIAKWCLSRLFFRPNRITATNKETIYYMNNILETSLRLTHSPISIKGFNHIKKASVHDSEFWHEKENLDKASIYIIGKWEVPVFVPRRELSTKSRLILDVEVGKESPISELYLLQLLLTSHSSLLLRQMRPSVRPHGISLPVFPRLLAWSTYMGYGCLLDFSVRHT